MSDDKHKTFADGFAAIFKNFGDLVERIETLSKVSSDGDGVNISWEGGDDAPVEGVFGFTIKTGARAGRGRRVRVEPFGNIRREPGAQSTRVTEIREPMTDVFEENDHILVVAEMPGVAADEIEVEIHGDVLLLSTEKTQRKYRKELVLPQRCATPAESLTCNNGIVEIKLRVDKSTPDVQEAGS
ncbi:MAG: Hsp20/alpha crystallin family protein [Nannocystaceae bacterium]